MSRSAKKSAPARATMTRVPVLEKSVLRLRWTLAELPSAQHRAGLAGLVLMVQWLDRQPGALHGVCRITALDAFGADFECDEAGLGRLFDVTYAAENVLRFYPQQRKNQRTKVVEQPVEVREEAKTDANGKTRTRTLYGYYDVVPQGAFLLDWDPGRDRSEGPWIKLWRDMLWSIFRGVPATRRPYQARANHEVPDDAWEAWKDLQAGDHSVKLPSTYFLGAQEYTAESVPFFDRARFQFLLHFWPFVAGVYVPRVIDVQKDGMSGGGFSGYALAVPDVARLDLFCEELPDVLRYRGVERAGYRPRDAVIDVIAESALDLANRLAERLAEKTGRQAIEDLVLGYEVFHVAKLGNNVTTLASVRIAPAASMVDEYALRQRAYRDALFRRTRVANLVAGRPWYAGFDTLAETTPARTQTIGSRAFRRDAHHAFKSETRSEEPMPDTRNDAPLRTIEQLVHHLIRTFVRRRVKARSNLDWAAVKSMPPDNPKRRKYNEEKEAVARTAFLAVRSRTGVDFVDWFTGTICSVPQRLRADEFVALSNVLRDDPATVRTLTLLALSAAS